jgi:hypothetical protein
MREQHIRRCTRCGTTGPHDIEWQVSSGQWLTLVVLIICGVVPGILYGIWLGFTGGNHGLWICTACGARRASVPAVAVTVPNEPPDPTW